VATNIATIGVILAGGLSSRMGQDKALMRMADTCMLDHISQVLNKTTVKEIVISRNDENGRYLSDIIPNKGPLSGIHSAAMHYPSDDLLIVPVDLPLIDRFTLEELINYGHRHRCNARYAGQSLPLYVNNTEALRQALDHTLRATNSFSVNRFCSHFSLGELNLEKKLSLLNINTPEQWQIAEQHF
jgi:molybdopterin-guanine dinucleotide biosynthesis protein A